MAAINKKGMNRVRAFALLLFTCLSVWYLVYKMPQQNRIKQHLDVVKSRMHYQEVIVLDEVSIGTKYMYSFQATNHLQDSIVGTFVGHKDKVIAVWVESVNNEKTDFY